MAVVTVAVAVAALAAEKQRTARERVLHVLSDGKVVAEVRLVGPASFLCSGALRVTPEGYGTYSTKEPALKATLLFNDKKVVLDLSGNVQFAGQLEDLGIQHQPARVESGGAGNNHRSGQ